MPAPDPAAHAAAGIAAPPDTLDISARHYFWKLRLAFSKAIELRAYQDLATGGALDGRRVLDLGCSDGVFTRMLGEAVGLAPPSVGGDRDLRALREAAAPGRMHRALVRLDAGALPLRSGSFDLVLANGVLAHVRPDPATALREVRRVLAPGGRFVFSVPTARHADYYWSVLLAEAVGLAGLAEARRRRVNRNEGYTTLLSCEGWSAAVDGAGLRVARVLAYSGRAVAWRRSFLGTPLLRAAGVLRLVPSGAFRRACASGVAALLRGAVERRSRNVVTPEDADYLLVVAEREPACAR